MSDGKQGRGQGGTTKHLGTDANADMHQPHGLFAHVGETRVDVAYWDTPFPLRVYFRLMYAGCGALCAAMVLNRFGVTDVVQWVCGIVVFAYVLTFRWFRPHGFQNVYDDFWEANLQGTKELQEGNYDGVPLFLVPDKDYERVRAERESERAHASANLKAAQDSHHGTKKP